MAIGTTGSVGADVPAGTQVRWEVKEASFEPDGRYGPDVELDLVIVSPEFFGTNTRYWAKIAQPRLDKATKLRGEGLDDETIAAALRKQGFEFDKLDDADAMLVSRGGTLFKMLIADNGDAKTADKVLQECGDFDELAAKLVGTRFVGTTKLSKDGYVRLDATEEIYVDKESPDAAGAGAEEEEDSDDIPW